MNKKIDLRISEELHKALQNKANSEKISVSSIVRQILTNHFNLSDKQPKKEVKRPTNKTLSDKPKIVATQKEVKQLPNKYKGLRLPSNW